MQEYWAKREERDRELARLKREKARYEADALTADECLQFIEDVADFEEKYGKEALRR